MPISKRLLLIDQCLHVEFNVHSFGGKFKGTTSDLVSIGSNLATLKADICWVPELYRFKFFTHFLGSLFSRKE